MMARVQLDASHVSKVCNWQERESDQVYKSSQRTFEVHTFRLYSLRLRVLEHTVRENIARFLEIS